MALLQIDDPARPRLTVGIDLGTTNSMLAGVVDGKASALRDASGAPGKPMPSLVRYRADGPPEVGEAAVQGFAQDPLNTIASAKRLMGRAPSELEGLAEELPYRLAAVGGAAGVATVAGERTAVEISGAILSELAKRARTALGGEIEGAVVTVPAYFSDAQRQATRDAARLAGLPLLRLLNEPTAAALAYGLDSDAQALDGRTVMVYDLGGGTFDVSLLRLEGRVFETLATGGDTQLGGDDIDGLIARHIVGAQTWGDLPLAQRRELLNLARRGKEELSANASWSWEWAGASGALSRRELEAMTDPIIQRTLSVCDQTLSDAGLRREAIDEVVLVGGATRMPRVRELVASWSGREPLHEIDPDRIVAYGAALQADQLAGNASHDKLLLDVLPLSVGIEVMGGLVEVVIPRNTAIPVTMTRRFTTFRDGQQAMEIHVLQGERDRVADCRSLARFELRGLSPRPAGAVRVEVIFAVDADGLLRVTARQEDGEASVAVSVRPSSGLSEEQMERMLLEAFEHAEDDKQARALAEARQEARELLGRLETILAEDGDELLEAGERASIDRAAEQLRAAVEGNDADAIRESEGELNATCENFVTRRMDATLRAALRGRSLAEISARVTE